MGRGGSVSGFALDKQGRASSLPSALPGNTIGWGDCCFLVALCSGQVQHCQFIAIPTKIPTDIFCGN